MEHLCKVITAAQPSVQRGGRQKKHSQTQPLTHSLRTWPVSQVFFCNKVKGREASEGEKKQRDDRERKRKPSEMW